MIELDVIKIRLNRISEILEKAREEADKYEAEHKDDPYRYAHICGIYSGYNTLVSAMLENTIDD
jgi:hypothetical protein